MELKEIFRLMFKRWLLVVPIVLIAVAATYFLTQMQPVLYTARTTFVMRLNEQYIDTRGLVSAVDVLNRNSAISATYSEIAKSAKIKQLAGARLGLDENVLRHFTVDSQSVAGTNLLEMSVQTLDPVLAMEFANAVGAETMAYVTTLYPAFQMELLDPAVAPRNPSSPNLFLNLGMAAVLSLFLGFSLAMLSAYLQPMPSTRGTVPGRGGSPLPISQTGKREHRDRSDMPLRPEEMTQPVPRSKNS
jgi:capsular polysaccharide biosynthesis protein